MMFTRMMIFSAIFAIVPTLTARNAFADLIVEMVGGLSWDRTAMPVVSPDFLFSISVDNNINVNGNDLNAFSLALRFVPSPGAIGTIEIGTASQATVNSVFAAFAPLNVTEPTANVFAINGTNSPAVENVNVTSPQNLFALNLTTTDNASGIFEIYAVPEFTNYFDTGEFDGFKFANVPDGPDVFLGTLNVTAVPEPSSLIFTAVAVGGLMTARRRKKQSGQKKQTVRPL